MLPSTAALLALVTFAGTALADEVGNPGDSTLAVPNIASGGDSLYVGSTASVELSGTMDISVAATAATTFTTASFDYHSTGLTTSASAAINAKLVVATGSSTATVDPRTGEVTLNLHAKFSFDWTAKGQVCESPFFDVTLSTLNTGGSSYDAFGHFVARSSSWAIAAMTTGCDNSANAPRSTPGWALVSPRAPSR